MWNTDQRTSSCLQPGETADGAQERIESHGRWAGRMYHVLTDVPARESVGHRQCLQTEFPG